MNASVRRRLRFFGTALVLVSVIVHLWWGLPRFLIYAQPQTLMFYLRSGGVPDPRPFLFMGLVLAVAVLAVALWRDLIGYRTAYTVTIALLIGSIGGWVLWHTVLNHGIALTASNPTAAAAVEGHQEGVLETVITHLITVPLEGGTKLAELAAIVIFGVLLWADSPTATEAK